MADDGLKIRLRIDDTDVRSSAKELKKSFQEISSAFADKEVSTKFASLHGQLERSIQKADKLRAEMKALEGTMVESDYSKLTSELDKVTAKYDDMLTRRAKIIESGKDVPRSLEYNIEATDEKIQKLNAQIGVLEATKQTDLTVSGKMTAEYAELEQRLGNVNAQASIQYTKLQELATAENELAYAEENLATAENEDAQAGTELEQKMIKIIGIFYNWKETIGNLVKSGLKYLGKSMLDIVKTAIPAMIKGAGKLIIKLGQLTKSIIKTYVNMGKLTATRIKNFFSGGSKSVDNMSKSFKRGLTKVFAYGFGIRSLFRLFNKLRGYAKDALGTMAKQFDDVNRDMSKIVSTFSKFKNSIGTMVQPIIHALMPVLVKLLNVLSAVMTKVGEFFAVLTGQKYIYKATDANIDYAKSLDDATASTKKNTKEVKKNQNQLGYYDKLNVIGKDNDKDKTPDTSGLGGVGGDAGASGFIKADPSKAVSEFAKKVKEAWKKGDFTEVGNIIGKNLQKALNNIPWAGIQKMAKKLGKSLGTLINGFVETETGGINLGTTIGESIAEAINTAIMGINSFLKNTHWKSVANFIVNGINGAIKKIKWKLLGKTFGRAVNAIVTLLGTFWSKTDWKLFGSNFMKAIISFFKTLDFKKIGEALTGWVTMIPKFVTGALKEIDWDNAWANFKTKMGDFFSGIDWAEIFGSLGEMAGSIAKALYNVFKDIWADVTAYFDPYIKSAGGKGGKKIFNGVLAGIKDGVKNIGKWLQKNVIDPFVNAFKKGFGIHSPSTVMMEIGGYIIQGLFNGIKSGWNTAVKFIKTLPAKIKGIFINIPSTLGNIFSDAFNRIKSIFSLSNVKTFFTAVLDGIKAVFVGKSGKGGIIGILKGAFSDAWKGIKSVFSKGGELFEGIKNGVADTFTSVVKSLLKGINSVISVPFEKINDLLEDLKDVKIPLPKPLKDIKPFTFVKTIPVPQIPELAQGAVIPPNREFLAMLGDQKQGTNIETPLDTMIQAFNTALAQNNGATSHEDIVLRLDGRDIAKAVWDEDTKKYKQSGAFMPRYS